MSFSSPPGRLPASSVLDGIAGLVDQNLLGRHEGPDGEPRFAMLETIREFGVELLTASGEMPALRRVHARYYVDLAEAAEPALTSGGRMPWLRRLNADQSNVRVAMQWIIEAKEAELGLRMTGALWLWFWLSFREGRQWATALLALPGAEQPTVWRARALVTAATTAWGERRPRRGRSRNHLRGVSRRGSAVGRSLVGRVRACLPRDLRRATG